MSTYVDDLVKTAMSDSGPQHKVVKLPCCGASIEITRTGDQLLQCPRCYKHHALTWSLNPKLETEVKDERTSRTIIT